MSIRVSEKIDKELSDAIMKIAKSIAKKKGKKKKKVNQLTWLFKYATR
jgi:hypothetical protein